MMCALALSVLTNGAGAVAAQDKQEKKTIHVEDDFILQGPEGHPPPGNTFVFVSEMSFDGKSVKGAPYSAQAVTEFVHTLADGNRITRKNTANVYRDSEGRTRRDQTLGAIGPFGVAGDPPQTITINDPVSGATYSLDPRTRTARKMMRREFNFEFKPGDKKFEFRTSERVPPPPAGKDGTKEKLVVKSLPRTQSEPLRVAGDVENFVITAPAPMPGHGPMPPDVHVFRSDSKPQVEKLGSREIEGVNAEGTRTVMTIPAGAIGNEQAIEIVSERWYSPELQTVIMSRHSDPRFGETVYRLTNINRSEPAATLFQVPSDYTIKEAPAFGTPMRRTRSKTPEH
jgi:hypothetical protein